MSLAELAFDAKRGAERVRQWMEAVVGPALGEEGFDSCYSAIVDRAYCCPGDDDWFSFVEPQSSFSRGIVLATLRTALSERFYSEERASAKTVWDAALRHQYGNVARDFVIEAFDAYLQMRFALKWRNAVIIEHDEIESSGVKLHRAPMPLLVQVFSQYWPYDQFAYAQDIVYVWPCNSVYEAIAVWMHQCARNYRGRVLGVDISACIREVIYADGDTETLGDASGVPI